MVVSLLIFFVIFLIVHVMVILTRNNIVIQSRSLFGKQHKQICFWKTALKILVNIHMHPTKETEENDNHMYKNYYNEMEHQDCTKLDISVLCTFTWFVSTLSLFLWEKNEYKSNEHCSFLENLIVSYMPFGTLPERDRYPLLGHG